MSVLIFVSRDFELGRTWLLACRRTLPSVLHRANFQSPDLDLVLEAQRLSLGLEYFFFHCSMFIEQDKVVIE